jgi:hypothetical protein
MTRDADPVRAQLLSDLVLDAASNAVAASADVWTGFARNDAKVCLRAALNAAGPLPAAAAAQGTPARLSHEEYVAGCDESQLQNLIERANARLEKIRKSGWIKLWTVSIGWANVAWFEEREHGAAVAFARDAVAAEALRRPAKGIEMEVKLESFRPEEVPGLLAATPKPVADRATKTEG